MQIKTVNPATGQVIRAYEEMRPEEAARIVDSTHQAFLLWSREGFPERAGRMREAARILTARKSEYARLITSEMGKTLKSATNEVEKCAWGCEYFADHAAAYLRPRVVQTQMSKSYVVYQPLGVVLAIMPWNFPFWQVFRFAAAGMMAGNATVLKHASACTGTALALEELFREARFPENLFRTLVIAGSAVAELIDHPAVRGVTLTGSDKTGKLVASRAGQALKKVVMELGGSDPYLVLADNDDESLARAAETCVSARMLVSGQVCIAAKRLIVVEEVREAFTRKVLERLRLCRMGDPMAEDTDLGPLARGDLREEVHGQVRASLERGAGLLLGGEIPAGPGFFYPPTLLVNVRKGMPAYDDEVFGPVVAILPARDEAEAIRIANDSRFGLGAAVFTRDLARGEAIAAGEIEAGTCVVNAAVSTDPRVPFGGIKNSGYGRELSEEGVREFTNVKTVHVR